MQGFSTRMYPATAPEPSKLPTRNMRTKINGLSYGQRVRDNEQGVFTPLVFSTTGGLGQEATTFYKRLACRHARLEIRKNYSCSIKVISWLRCKLCFAAVRSSIMCIRGTRSSNHGPLRDDSYVMTIQEGSNLINCHCHKLALANASRHVLLRSDVIDNRRGSFFYNVMLRYNTMIHQYNECPYIYYCTSVNAMGKLQGRGIFL